MSCRICFDDDNYELMSDICKCKGSLKYIHKKCLFKSIHYNGVVCKTCNTKYFIHYQFLKLAFIEAVKYYFYFNITYWILDLFLSKNNLNWYNTIYVFCNDPLIKKWKNYHLINIKLLVRKFSLKSCLISMLYYLLESIEIRNIMNNNVRIFIFATEFYLIFIESRNFRRNYCLINIAINELYCFSKIFLLYFYNQFI